MQSRQINQELLQEKVKSFQFSLSAPPSWFTQSTKRSWRSCVHRIRVLLGAPCPGAAAAAATAFPLPTWVAAAPMMLQLLDSRFSIGLCCMTAGASITGRSVLGATCFRV